MSPRLHAVLGRVEDGYPGIPDQSCDLAVFSPPYFERDGWSLGLMVALGRLLVRVLKPGARAFMVFGQIQEGFDRPWESTCALLDGAGDVRSLALWQTIVWVKSLAIGGWQERTQCPSCEAKIAMTVPTLTRGHQQPITSDHLLHYAWEYVFQFVRGAPKEAPALDRLSVGVEYADKSNLKRGTRGKNGDVRCAGDVWYIPYETTGPSTKKLHRHSFPVELGRRCMKVAGLKPGQAVLEPFLGGGTTALAAFQQGLHVYGGDCSEDALAKTREVWQACGGSLLAEVESPYRQVDHREVRPGVYFVGG